MYAPQERNCIQHHCYRAQGLLLQRTAALLQRTRVIVTAEMFLVTEDKVCFFLFIALCWMQNPTGGCCSRLKIPELARGIFSRLQRPWLVRDICIQRKGFFRFLSFPKKQRKGFISVFVLSVETGQGRIFPGLCPFSRNSHRSRLPAEKNAWKAALRHSPHVPRSRLR